VDAVEVPSEDHGHWGLDTHDGQLHRLAYLPGHPSFPALWLESAAVFAGASPTTWMEAWAGRLWRRDRTFRGVLLASAPGGSELVITVPFPDGRADRPGVHQLRVGSDAAPALDQERLERLRPKPSESPESLTARLREELDVKNVTGDFFEALRRTHGRLASGFAGWGEAPTEAMRAEVALVTLNRLIFLYFLQRKRLLDGRPDFVRHHVREARTRGQGVYAHLLRPLFFAVLNTSVEARSQRAVSFGAIPYLNGGLFEPIRLEREHPDLTLSDETITQAFDALFERFVFTTREDGPGVGVDPEVLGRAFESLMAEGEREQTGTFYTPRALVRDVVREALAELLVGQGLGRPDALALLDGRVPAWLDAGRGEALLERVERATVLDPACGSGAFLLGAMHQLEQLFTTLRRALGLRVPARGLLRRRIVQHNLYGVDINPTAVHLCELRLWLAIVDAEPVGAPIDPLPNLDHRVRCGDSLLSSLDWLGQQVVWRDHREALEELEDFKAAYANATGADKRALRSILAAAEGGLLRDILEGQRDLGRRSRAPIVAMLEGRDLFGRKVRPPRGAQREREALDARLALLDGLLARLDREGVPPGFSPEVHFPEAMANGGFDVIVGNPPWVRPHAMPSARRELLRRRYAVLDNRGSGVVEGLRVHTGTGGQVDLSACFVERALELARPGGVVAMLLPAKLTRALYGAAFRQMVLRKARLSLVWELDPAHFTDAVTYPSVLVATALSAEPAPDTLRVRTVPDGLERTLPVDRLRLDAHDPGSPWALSALPQPLMQVQGDPRLGEHPSIRVSRGVMTGCNDAFVRGADLSLEAAWVHLVRGADIGAFSWSPGHRMLWPHSDATAAPLDALTPELAAELGPHRPALERRPELRRDDPWWRIFRTSAQLLGPKVAWRDLGARLQAVVLPASVDDRLIVPLNTVYYIPVPDEALAYALAGWLNSSAVRAFADVIAEHARTNYRRFFGWVISMLPVPARLWQALTASRLDVEDVHPALAELAELSRALHRQPALAMTRQHRIDALVAELYATPRHAQPARWLAGRAS